MLNGHQISDAGNNEVLIHPARLYSSQLTNSSLKTELRGDYLTANMTTKAKCESEQTKQDKIFNRELLSTINETVILVNNLFLCSYHAAGIQIKYLLKIQATGFSLTCK